MLQIRLFVNFGQYIISWIRICIPITDPDPGGPKIMLSNTDLDPQDWFLPSNGNNLFRIRTGLHADPDSDPATHLNTDPDPGSQLKSNPWCGSESGSWSAFADKLNAIFFFKFLHLCSTVVIRCKTILGWEKSCLEGGRRLGTVPYIRDST